MLTTGNILMPQMRNPVASSNKPPTALKSAIIDGVCNQVNHLIPTRVLVKGGEITCKILK